MWIIKSKTLYPLGTIHFLFHFIIWITCIQAQSIDLKPVFIYEYESDSEEYNQEDVDSHDFELGVLGCYNRPKLNIQKQRRIP